jgi:hypothetical protein
VRDRAAVRAFEPCALDVDVDPLAVARALGERVDPLLVDGDPAGDADSRPVNSPSVVIE